MPEEPIREKHRPFDLHPEVQGALAHRARKWGQAAATGWAAACMLGAVLLVVITWPSVVPSYGPSSLALETQWSDFEFRYPDAEAAAWESLGEHEIAGGVLWSEDAQRGLLRLEGLPSLSHETSHEAGEPHGPVASGWTYQVWLARGDDQPFIGAGTFDGPEPESVDEHDSYPSQREEDASDGHGSAAASIFVPLVPGVRASGIKAVVVTIEPAGGVWISDRSRTVAKAVLGDSGPEPRVESEGGH